MTAIPGTLPAHHQMSTLFWSITAVKGLPAFHLVIEPHIKQTTHSFTHSSTYTEPTLDQTHQINSLNNTIQLILDDLLYTMSLGQAPGFFPFPKNRHFGALGLVSAYLMAFDPCGPNGI